MTFIETMRDAIDRLAAFDELCVDPAALPASASRLSDALVRDLLHETAALSKQVSTLQAILSGVASARSSRDRRHGGLVQGTGHRNPIEFLRDIGGISRAEATRAVKVGEALLDGAGARGDAGKLGGDDVPDRGMRDAAPAPTPWHQPLGDAVLAGTITTAQHHAIRTGLGEPPATLARLGSLLSEAGSGPAHGDDDSGNDDSDRAEAGMHDAATVEAAWRAAAIRLITEAGTCTVEDLTARARAIRDLLDPCGAQARFAARFAKRSYRAWKDKDGIQHAAIVFDDEFAAFLNHLFDTALSPRRGGPRFVADDERTAAEALVADPRTNEQLAYDLLVDLIGAGAAVDHDDIYGSRQAGVRLVAIEETVTGSTAHRDAFGRLLTTATTDDGHCTLPGGALERALCVAGSVTITTDSHGNPLDVGREQRHFTPKQRTALSIRDGGCIWPGCDRPPSYTEAHHVDEWSRGGRTDIDRGVLLCRYHHLALHNNGWRITRDGTGPFLLHPPPGTGDPPVALRSKSPLRWIFDPPPERSTWRTAA